MGAVKDSVKAVEEGMHLYKASVEGLRKQPITCGSEICKLELRHRYGWLGFFVGKRKHHQVIGFVAIQLHSMSHPGILSDLSVYLVRSKALAEFPQCAVMHDWFRALFILAEFYRGGYIGVRGGGS